MGRFYLIADEHGWHHPVHRSDMSFDASAALRHSNPIEWSSVLTSSQHVNLVQQWMASSDDVLLSDEWIPAEWLLRAWSVPTMGAAEGGIGLKTRLFEIEADPVVLAHSIAITIPELGLAGVDRFRVVREVPRWWLLGPCGREALALLIQFRDLDVDALDRPTPNDAVGPELRGHALGLIDKAVRVGAYTTARAVVGEQTGPFTDHHQLALDAAIGFVLKDLWPEAPRMYRPWIQHYGLPDLAPAVPDDDVPYPQA